MEIHRRIWGIEKWIVNNKRYCGKILCLDKGYRCSYHYHKIKDETFHILKGIVLMRVDGKEQEMFPNDTIHIPPKTKHSFTGITYAEILEISTQHFEDDSYKLDESGKISSFEKGKMISLISSILLECHECGRKMLCELGIKEGDWQKHICVFCEIEIQIKIVGDEIIFKK